MRKYSSLLSTAVDSIIDTKEENDIDSLFRSGGTTFGSESFSGLDDFELIGMVMVK